MVLTTAAIQTFAVILAATLWRSRIGTWIAFGVVLVAAFALGNRRYGFVDALGAIAGLVIGLQMLPSPKPIAPLPPAPTEEPGMPPAPRAEPPLTALQAAVAAIFTVTGAGNVSNFTRVARSWLPRLG